MRLFRRFLVVAHVASVLVLNRGAQAEPNIRLIPRNCASGSGEIDVDWYGWLADQSCAVFYLVDGVTKLTETQCYPSGVQHVPVSGLSTGLHIVRRLALGLPSVWQNLECAEIDFRYVGLEFLTTWDTVQPIPAKKPAWRAGFYCVFNPIDCELPECQKVVFIQLVKTMSKVGSFPPQIITATELNGWRKGHIIDAETIQTSDAPGQPEYVGWRVDSSIKARRDPYLNGDDPTDVPDTSYRDWLGEWIQGSNIMFDLGTDSAVTTVVNARMTDSPWYPHKEDMALGEYPENVSSLIFEFEIAAFCAQGPGKGHWLGRGSWKWSKPADGKSDIPEPAPFIRFTEAQTESIPPLFELAIQKWVGNEELGFTRTFVLPTPSTLATGLEGRLGRKCGSQ